MANFGTEVDAVAVATERKSHKKPRSRILKLNLLTWNTNGKPPPDNLHQLFKNKSDVFTIGLQEMGYQDWVTAIDQALKRENVVRIKSRKLQGLLTIVYVRRHLLPYVTHIESEVTRTGLGGMWGNKGGVSIRFDIYGVNVIIVNCHLAAHMENVAQRVQDVTSIIDNQKFRDEEVNCVLDHDYVFWIGDMNFRVENTSYERAIELIENGDTDALLRKDQLKSVMDDGLIFDNFEESPIYFNPTYKFDPGTDVYDTSAKRRVPAFCDRILYYSHHDVYCKKDNLAVISHEYDSLPAFTSSDHKPVYSVVDFLGLRRPPCNPVVFKVSKTVHRKSSLKVDLTSRHMKLSSSDWVGLYFVDFVDFNKYMTYCYTSVGSNSKASKGSIEIHHSVFDSVPSDVYLVLCYFSKKNSFSGISKEFQLKD